MTELSVHPYSSAAPVFAVDGQTRGELARDLLRLDVQEGALGLRTMVAHLHAVGPDSDGSTEQLSYLDGQLLDLGSAITVTIGLSGAERKIFAGTISALEVCFEEGGVPYVSVFAEDALMRLRMTTRTATYENSSDADVLRAIAAEHGLSAQPDIDGPTFPVIQQWEASDLAFLRERAGRLDAELWVDSAEVIHLATRQRRPGAELTLVQGNELLRVSARADLAHQRVSVRMSGWDHDAVRPVTHAAQAAVVAAAVAGGQLGPDLAARHFPRATLTRSRRDVLDQDTATAYADAEMLRRARSFVTVEGTTAGTADLVPGARLDLRRVGRPFEGSGYRVVHARHSYDLVTGYRTDFRAERPQLT